MSSEDEIRDLEVLFEDQMRGYRCVVSRQLDGAINLQFEDVHTHELVTLPAQPASQWDTPEKLQALCAQLTEEFLIVRGLEAPEPSSKTQAVLEYSREIAERLTRYLSPKKHS